MGVIPPLTTVYPGAGGFVARLVAAGGTLAPPARVAGALVTVAWTTSGAPGVIPDGPGGLSPDEQA